MTVRQIEWYNEIRSEADQEKIILVPEAGDASARENILEETWNNMFKARCMPLCDLFAKDFDIVLKLAHPDIFNSETSQQHEALFSWIQQSSDSGGDVFKQRVFEFWEPIKNHLNENLLFAEKSLGLHHEELCEIAHQLNNLSYRTISHFSNPDFITKIVKTSRNKSDYSMTLLIATEDWLNSLKEVYINKNLDIISNPALQNSNNLIPDDINALLSFHLESIIYRRQLTGFGNDDKEARSIYNFFSDDSRPGSEVASTGAESSKKLSELPDGCLISYREINAAKIDFLLENKYSYTICCSEIPSKDYAEIYAELEKILRARYPYKDTSWRDNRSSIGFDWLRRGKARIAGAMDFEITFFADTIVIEYTQPKIDEGTRNVALLSFHAVEREFTRLQGVCTSEKNQQRFSEISNRWLSDRLKQIKEEVDTKKQSKLRKALAKDIKDKCKDIKTAKMLQAIFCVSMNNNVEKKSGTLLMVQRVGEWPEWLIQGAVPAAGITEKHN